MGITKVAKLQRQLNEALDTERNARSALQATRVEREEARKERDEATSNCAHLDTVLRRNQQHVRRLFSSIFHLNLELARKAGYIDRVKEMDSANGVSARIEEPDMETTVDLERSILASARSDRMVASIIDGMDSDILDQVLGRTEDTDYDRG